jgi:hypothetical protein
MKRVYDEERLSKKKKRRRKKSQASKNKKGKRKSRRRRRRKKDKFKKQKDSDNPLEKERLELLVGNKLPVLTQDESESSFIEAAFPLNVDNLEKTRSVYGAVTASQGEQNA